MTPSTRFLPVYEPLLTGNELEYVSDCIRSGWISSLGKYIPEFENQFARFCGTKHAVAVSNGTTALHLALSSLGIGPGDERCTTPGLRRFLWTASWKPGT
jgi:perosamine synthetase